MIDRAIICGMGFTQRHADKTGQPTGVAKLSYAIRESLPADELRRTLVICARWNADPRDLVRRIRNQANGNTIDIQLACYSWGCGCLARGFTKEAEKAGGFRFVSATLSDPVYRSRLFLFRWLAVSRIGKGWPVELSGQWEHVDVFEQHNDRPSAHPVRVDSVLHGVKSWTLKSYGHVQMDDAPEFHDMAMRRVSELTRRRMSH